ncbi:sugar porter family MFS transporter [Agriterribacter sp.]|uniref:sugar porter family MFS transporter n=1 Tax=Agriterribacter sp. TaxID=2821509 RepID=UPI002CEC66BD|nr:sugar porter family MFS transporter [Agriterribacter sp.]HRP57371.1 sugar porter family MFS transporter [Agriterribacter sp.]
MKDVNRKLLLWSIVVALGGFLFGFDVAVISGAEQDVKRIWHLSDVFHGIAIGVALYGTIAGALLGGIPATRFGRKKTLLWIGILYLVSAIGSAIAPGVYIFMVFRVLGGLAIGASSVVAPMYITEIAPAKNRGKLVATFQFNIVFGILMAYLSNYLLQGVGGENSWRLMLGVVAIPALIYTILVFFVPESPRWLIVRRGDYDTARKTLEVSDPLGVDEAIEALHRTINEDNQKESLSVFFSKRFSVPVFLAILIAFFNQLSGINAIIYFAPRVFELAGIDKHGAFLQSVGVGLVNLVFTMAGLYMIDRWGRKKLLLIGSIGYIISLTSVAAAFYFNCLGGMIVPSLLFLFIASHAIGQGAVIWVFISEIFPNSVRAYGQSLGASTHWILAAIITTIFPILAVKIGPAPIFAFFAIMMVLQLLWVIFFMPETKGKSLEQLEAKLIKAKPHEI